MCDAIRNVLALALATPSLSGLSLCQRGPPSFSLTPVWGTPEETCSFLADLFLAGDRLLRSFPGSGIGMCSLTTNW